MYRCAVADGDTICTPVWLVWVQPNWHNYYADSGLSAGATYRYAVGSSRGAGTDSDWSNVVTVMTVAQAPGAHRVDGERHDSHNHQPDLERAGGRRQRGDYQLQRVQL